MRLAFGSSQIYCWETTPDVYCPITDRNYAVILLAKMSSNTAVSIRSNDVLSHLLWANVMLQTAKLAFANVKKPH